MRKKILLIDVGVNGKEANVGIWLEVWLLAVEKMTKGYLLMLVWSEWRAASIAYCSQYYKNGRSWQAVVDEAEVITGDIFPHCWLSAHIEESIWRSSRQGQNNKWNDRLQDAEPLLHKEFTGDREIIIRKFKLTDKGGTRSVKDD